MSAYSAAVLRPGGLSAHRQGAAAGGMRRTHLGASQQAFLTTRTQPPRQAPRLVVLAGRKTTAQKKQQSSKKRKPAEEAPKADQTLPAYETSDVCPCGSGNAYTECCEPYIYGDAVPDTCEQLMRSRFSAFAKRETKYVCSTTHPEHNELKKLTETEMIQDIAATAKNCCFHKLVVLDTPESKNPDEGVVTFRAWFKFVKWKGKKAVQNAEWNTLTETSTFKKKDGKWLYVSGETDVTEFEVGDGRPLNVKTDSMANLADKAKELDKQAKDKAKELFLGTSITEGMRSVFGNGKAK